MKKSALAALGAVAAFTLWKQRTPSKPARPQPKIGPHILVIGGGFGGLYTIRALSRLLEHSEAHLTLVSRRNYFTFTPLLHEVASGWIEARHAVHTIRPLANECFTFAQDEITDIDLNAKKATGKAATYSYDYLVLAPGCVTHYFGTPGAREHSLTLHSVEDAVRLRTQVIANLERAALESDPVERRRLLTTVVVGAGPGGLEIVTSLKDALGKLLNHYPELSADLARLVVVDYAPEVLPQFDPKLRRLARKRLGQMRIETHLSRKVTRVGADSIELDGGQVINTGLVVWTAGVTPDPLVERLDSEKNERGRLVCEQTLQLKNRPEVFVVGDAAAVNDPDGKTAPQLAQVAVQQAPLAARNLVALLRHEPLESYAYRLRGQLVELGDRYALQESFGLRFHGFTAWTVWRAYYLSRLLKPSQQLRILTDWLFVLLSGRDGAQLHYDEVFGLQRKSGDKTVD